MTAEPAIHELSDRALYAQHRFWRANAGLDGPARAFLRGCEREMAARDIDPDAPPPPPDAPEFRAALARLLDRATCSLVGSGRLHIALDRRELHDLQAMVLDADDPTGGLCK